LALLKIKKKQRGSRTPKDTRLGSQTLQI